MGAGAQLKFPITIASGVSQSSGIDLGHSWHQVWLEVPSMASGSDIFFLGSSDNITYRRVYQAATISNSSPGPYTVTSGVTNCFVPLPQSHMRYFKIQLGTPTSLTSYGFNVVACGEFT